MRAVRRGAATALAVAVLVAAAVLAPGGPAARAASALTPAITVADGNTVIAVQTSGDGLRFYWNEHGTDTWHGEQVAADGTTFSAPSIAQDGNSVVIAAQGVGNSLDFYWAQDGTTTWHPETLPALESGAPAITTSPGGYTLSPRRPSRSGSATNPPPTEPVSGSGSR